MDLRYLAARAVGSGLFAILRALGSGGTSLPGKAALALDPRFVAKMLGPLNTVVVAGTNGKTTTATLLAELLRADGRQVLHNRSGANLLRGVASLLIEHAEREWAVLEFDEFAFKDAGQLQPRLVLLLNLFRDQMDRYGEIDRISRLWSGILPTLAGAQLLVNADDPSLGWLGRQRPGARCFGITDPEIGARELHHTADAVLAPTDGKRFRYERVFYSHLGLYRSRDGKFSRPAPEFAISEIKLNGFDGASFTLTAGGTILELATTLPGLYNVYNVGAAAAAALTLGVAPETVRAGVANFRAAFGRFEQIALPGGKRLILFLIKNPVGFNQVISLLHEVKRTPELLLAINDNIADGRDVSWLWDADLETLAGVPRRIVTAGSRAHEMALRLKYAGFPAGNLLVENGPVAALDRLLALATTDTVCGLLTYTAMLDLHRHLSGRGLTTPFYARKS